MKRAIWRVWDRAVVPFEPKVRTSRQIVEAHPRMPRQRQMPIGDIYEGHGLIARHHFTGAKRHKGRLI
jgi:hypothetical protein